MGVVVVSCGSIMVYNGSCLQEGKREKIITAASRAKAKIKERIFCKRMFAGEKGLKAAELKQSAMNVSRAGIIMVLLPEPGKRTAERESNKSRPQFLASTMRNDRSDFNRHHRARYLQRMPSYLPQGRLCLRRRWRSAI